MNTFKIMYEEVVKVCKKTEFEVVADTIEEARDKALSSLSSKSTSPDVTEVSTQFVDTTQEKLTDKQNYCIANADILVQGEFVDRDDFYSTVQFKPDESFQINSDNPPQL